MGGKLFVDLKLIISVSYDLWFSVDFCLWVVVYWGGIVY